METAHQKMNTKTDIDASQNVNGVFAVQPPRWLEWAREVQALSQTGLYYAENHYQVQRYQRLAEIAAEIISESSGLEYQSLAGAFQAQLGYATPKVDVRAAAFREHKILLVCERNDGCWAMPGGWADVGDVPSQSAEREAWEEAGFRVRAHKVVGVYDANRTGPLEIFHAFKIVFLCEIVGGEARPSDETSQVTFFGKHEIPLLSGERTRLRHILDAFTALDNPQSPCQFD